MYLSSQVLDACSIIEEFGLRIESVSHPERKIIFSMPDSGAVSFTYFEVSNCEEVMEVLMESSFIIEE